MSSASLSELACGEISFESLSAEFDWWFPWFPHSRHSAIQASYKIVNQLRQIGFKPIAPFGKVLVIGGGVYSPEVVALLKLGFLDQNSEVVALDKEDGLRNFRTCLEVHSGDREPFPNGSGGVTYYPGTVDRVFFDQNRDEKFDFVTAFNMQPDFLIGNTRLIRAISQGGTFLYVGSNPYPTDGLVGFDLSVVEDTGNPFGKFPTNALIATKYE